MELQARETQSAPLSTQSQERGPTPLMECYRLTTKSNKLTTDIEGRLEAQTWQGYVAFKDAIIAFKEMPKAKNWMERTAFSDDNGKSYHTPKCQREGCTVGPQKSCCKTMFDVQGYSMQAESQDTQKVTIYGHWAMLKSPGLAPDSNEFSPDLQDPSSWAASELAYVGSCSPIDPVWVGPGIRELEDDGNLDAELKPAQPLLILPAHRFFPKPRSSTTMFKTYFDCVSHTIYETATDTLLLRFISGPKEARQVVNAYWAAGGTLVDCGAEGKKSISGSFAVTGNLSKANPEVFRLFKHGEDPLFSSTGIISKSTDNSLVNIIHSAESLVIDWAHLSEKAANSLQWQTHKGVNLENVIYASMKCRQPLTRKYVKNLFKKLEQYAQLDELNPSDESGILFLEQQNDELKRHLKELETQAGGGLSEGNKRLEERLAQLAEGSIVATQAEVESLLEIAEARRASWQTRKMLLCMKYDRAKIRGELHRN